jgi:hypothetical protein
MTRAEAAAEMYRQGATLRQITAALGKQPSVWRKRILACGVTLRPPGRPAAIDLVRAQALIDYGIKQGDVARHFGVTPAAISAAIAAGRLRKRGNA